jgi:hypothetical protein
MLWYLNAIKDCRLRIGQAVSGALRGEGDDAHRFDVDSDYAGCLEDLELAKGLAITFGGAVDL